MSDQPAATDDAHIARAEGLVASDVNGEVVILSIEVGHFFHLNATASRIWDLLDAPMTLAALNPARNPQTHMTQPGASPNQW